MFAAATQTEAGGTSPPVRTTTDDGVPLTELIDIQLRNVRLRIPAGYLAPWPTQAMRGRLNVVDSLNLNFWLLARRYPDIDPLLMPRNRRPAEAGRPASAQDSVVEVQALQPRAPAEAGLNPPDELFRRLMSGGGEAEYLFDEEPFSLVRFRQRNSKRQALLTAYRGKQGADIQALLTCSTTDIPTPDPSCKAHVFIASADLRFSMYFSRDRLSDWQAIVRAVRDMLASWSYGADARAPQAGAIFALLGHESRGSIDAIEAAATADLKQAFPTGSSARRFIDQMIAQPGLCRRNTDVFDPNRHAFKSTGYVYCEIDYRLPNERLSEIYVIWKLSAGYDPATDYLEGIKVRWTGQ